MKTLITGTIENRRNARLISKAARNGQTIITNEDGSYTIVINK